MANSSSAYPLSLIKLAQLAECCNSDDDFRQWGQYFTGAISLECGPHAAWLDVVSGEVRAVGAAAADDCVIRLRGELSAWQQIWDGLPGGLHRAWRHQLLQFQGDQSALMRHYKMVWRLGDLMHAAGW